MEPFLEEVVSLLVEGGDLVGQGVAHEVVALGAGAGPPLHLQVGPRHIAHLGRVFALCRSCLKKRDQKTQNGNINVLV